MQPRIARIVSVALVLGALAALAGAAAPAQANGNPLTITLSYLNGVSNWGPTNAAGVAELVGREGEVRLVASGLPQLRGERYQLWLMDPAHGKRLPLGTFGAGEDGVAKLDVVLDDVIPDKEWNLLMISVEAESLQGSGPSANELVKVLQAQRTYQANLRALRTVDEMIQEANICDVRYATQFLS